MRITSSSPWVDYLTYRIDLVALPVKKTKKQNKKNNNTANRLPSLNLAIHYDILLLLFGI